MSLSARRAWIEMLPAESSTCRRGVALRKESVDRNQARPDLITNREVALRKESVDRNRSWLRKEVNNMAVALRKESVDRNTEPAGLRAMAGRSLSARRAWIEISGGRSTRSAVSTVALRKESVDRNILRIAKQGRGISSLSARRAWIEMIRAN